ncbi:hypothetical protein [Streptomyces sp. NPDC006552]|uniref:hypothetical protein n=1 Tax=Streptomyces sp. NPDC006552 TaxID=3157179 RepID=UPI0033BD8B19
MPDRSLRLTLPHGAVLLREGRPTPPSPSTEAGGATPAGRPGQSREPDGSKDPAEDKGSAEGEGSGQTRADNPFAPPPEDAPDRPWQPRRPEGQDSTGGGEPRSPWGSQWSDRQPGRAQDGRFGDRPGSGGQGGPEGKGPGQGPGLRWDPTDPAQRRARYSILSGMWGFFFALFGWPYVALLLGALALYWSISALRAKPRTPDPDTPAPATPPGATRQQTTAAVSGLVTGALALAMVASMFTAKLVYSDYFECRADALTNAADQSCDDLLPKQLRPLLGSR